MKKIIHVPAQTWIRLAATNSAMMAAQEKPQNEKRSLRVLFTEYRGFYYTAFSVMHGGYGTKQRPSIDAYRLLPVAMWRGETFETIGDLTKKIKSDERYRGSYVGLRVSAREEMVCAIQTSFVLDLPTTKPVPLSVAEKYDAKQRRSGWRALWFRRATPSWGSLEKHPVAIYENGLDGMSRAVLLWREGKSMRELMIENGVPLGPKEEVDEQGSGGWYGEQLPLQLCDS